MVLRSMNRRQFITSTLLASLACPAIASNPVASIGQVPIGPLQVLSPNEIGQHFIYVNRPVFSTEDSHGQKTNYVVRTYYTKSATFDNVWFNPDGTVNQTERRRVAREVVAYIKGWFRAYQHSWRNKAEVFGPYVHEVHLMYSPLVDHNGQLKRAAFMRLACARISV